VEYPSESSLLDSLRGIIDPELGASIVELGMVESLTFDSTDTVMATIALTTLSCPLRSRLQQQIRDNLMQLPGVTDVRFQMTEMSKEGRRQAMMTARRVASERSGSQNLAAAKRVIAISSGKGGVGKSTTTVALAQALARMGKSVGVLDADIWGYSVPALLQINDRRLEAQGTRSEWRLQPVEVEVEGTTIKVVSMGMLADDDTSAIMWRGMMLSRAFQHFLEDVEWGDLDYLLIDMPPGTGDIQLTLARLVPNAFSIVVTTPDSRAATVATRAGDMARRSNMTVIGVVENMSYLRCEHGAQYEVFGAGGGSMVAARLGVALLGKVPIGTSFDSHLAFNEIAESLHRSIETELASREGCTARLLHALDQAVNLAV
jgi:ATP-binding protein involved in chromosome partitioning